MVPYRGEPPRGGEEERRESFRREDDEESHAIVDRTVHDAPIIRFLRSAGGVATAIIAIVGLIGGAGAAIGMNYRGPKQGIEEVNLRVDTNSVRIAGLRHEVDSALLVVRDMQRDIKTTANLSCMTARARNPEIAKAAGCDQREP